MKYKIIIIGILIVFVYCNIYKYKRIKRRMIIKKMKVDNNINELIDEFKRDMKNKPELKNIQNKMRIIQIAKYIFYAILILVSILLPFIYILYKIGLKKETLAIDEGYNMLAIYAVLLVTEIIAFFCIESRVAKNYLKNKTILKEYIYNDFLRKLKYDIKWYDKYSPTVSEKTYKMWDTYIRGEEAYQKANFNKIQSDEDIYTNTLFSKISTPNEI